MQWFKRGQADCKFLLLLFLTQVISLPLQSEDCLPEVATYHITASSADVAVVVDEMVTTTTFTLQNISSSETYSITIVPSNTLGLGSPMSTIISKS